MVVWLDGREVYRRCNMVLRLKTDVLIERFSGRNFHGGSVDPFRPDHTQYMWCAPPVLFSTVRIARFCLRMCRLDLT